MGMYKQDFELRKMDLMDDLWFKRIDKAEFVKLWDELTRDYDEALELAEMEQSK